MVSEPVFEAPDVWTPLTYQALTKIVSDARMGNLSLIPQCKTTLDVSVPEKHWQELRGKGNEEEAGGIDS